MRVVDRVAAPIPMCRKAARRTGILWVVRYIRKCRHKKSPEPFGSGRGLDKKDSSEPETYCCGGRKVKDNCTGDSDFVDIFQNDLFNVSIVFHVLSPRWSIKNCLRVSRSWRGIREIKCHEYWLTCCMVIFLWLGRGGVIAAPLCLGDGLEDFAELLDYYINIQAALKGVSLLNSAPRFSD